MKYITRNIENYVKTADKSFKCILVTGARQSGKSTMLKNIFPEKHYITFDDIFVEQRARENGDLFLSMSPPPIILDEVQRVPELFRYIKIKCDESEETGLYDLSGSQPFHLMQNISESLSGRVCIVELSPLSLREIQGNSFHEYFLPTMDYIMERRKTAKKPKNIWKIIHRGGFPELYQKKDFDWQAFYASYVKTYLERDVRELSAVQDLDAFRRFMVAVAARTGQIVNYSNIAREIAKDVGTIRRWMSILEASGIIYLLEPYAPAALKRAIRTPKVYFRDTGLASYLTRWMTPDTLAVGAMNGSIFETFVISEILKSYSNSGIDYRYCVSYYRGKDKRKQRKNGDDIYVENEIDFIIEENGTLYPIEIKMSASENASAASAFSVLDMVEEKKRGMGAVINMCPEPGMITEEILEIPVWYI